MMINQLYFCECCRKQIENVGDLHFVEDHSDRGFCSEKCIKDFYRPYMQQLEIEEKEQRKSMQILAEEDDLDYLANEHYLNQALYHPHEKWLLENEMGQKFYTHILNIETELGPLYFILICSCIDNDPSFVFYRMVTRHIPLKEYYQRDIPVEENDSSEKYVKDIEDQYEIPADIIELLENKKSQILAQMMQERSPGDIAIEDFTSYDKFLEQTIENPDEIYEYEDAEGDVLNNFIKSFKVKELSFFYVAILYPYQIEKTGDKAVLPIMGFPSVDNNLYPNYALGKNLNEKLKN